MYMHLLVSWLIYSKYCRPLGPASCDSYVLYPLPRLSDRPRKDLDMFIIEFTKQFEVFLGLRWYMELSLSGNDVKI